MPADRPLPSPSNDRRAESDQGLNEFKALIEQARAGDQQACKKLFDDYHKHVLTVIRRRIDKRVRRRLESIDIAQEVWLAAFREALSRGFAGPAQFVSYLTTVGERLTLKTFRHEVAAQKRSVSREEPLSTPAGKTPGDSADA